MARLSDLNSEYGKTSNDFLLYEKAAIQQQLIAMLRCKTTSRYFRPNLKSPLYSLLQLPISPITASDIIYEIDSMIIERMNGVEMDMGASAIEPNYIKKCYDITLAYVYTRNSERDEISFTLQGV